MELADTLQYGGWTIRYALINPSTAEALRSLIFVHGTPWSSAVFGPIITSLLSSSSIQIFVYDLPGYGRSQEFSPTTQKHCGGIHKPLFEGDTSVKFQAKALEALLRHVGLVNTRPSVIAHDIAGSIVLRAATLHHVEFSDMLFMDTNCVLPWGDGFYNAVRNDPQSYCELSAESYEKTLRDVIRSARYDDSSLGDPWEDALAEPWLAYGQGDPMHRRDAQLSFVRQIVQANDADIAEMLETKLYARITCPVTILWADQDQWIPKEKMDALVKLLTACETRFVVIPDAGHLLMLDQPERVADEVIRWHTSVDTGDG